MADANAIYLSGYPASLETLSPGLSPPPSLVPLSPPIRPCLLPSLPRITQVVLFITHQHTSYYFIITIIYYSSSQFCFWFFSSPTYFTFVVLMADANAMYHPSFIIYYSSTHYLFTYYFLINPFFFHLGWLMLTSCSS